MQETGTAHAARSGKHLAYKAVPFITASKDTDHPGTNLTKEAKTCTLRTT